MSTLPSLLECRGVNKRYGEGALAVSVLHDLNLVLREGEDLVITGASGSGKSTLMHLLGGLDFPDSGEVVVHGKALHGMSEVARCNWRNREVGFVYQFHHLLAEFTVLENVAMPLLVAGQSLSSIRSKAFGLLEKAGLDERAMHKPHELSGGERQRVAICRAIISKPRLILADEPTGNLDRATAQRVIDVMFNIKAESGATFVVVTHDESLARRFDRNIHLEAGRLRE